MFTEEEVQEMIMLAFMKGETWGMCYGWFPPTNEEKANKGSEECFEIYNNMVLKKQKQQNEN